MRTHSLSFAHANSSLHLALNAEKSTSFNFQRSTLVSAFSSQQIASYRSHQREDSIRSLLVASVNETYDVIDVKVFGVYMHKAVNIPNNQIDFTTKCCKKYRLLKKNASNKNYTELNFLQKSHLHEWSQGTPKIVVFEIL